MQTYIFGFLEPGQIDLQSPRVKNEHLRPYFSLAHFVLMLTIVIEKQPKKKILTPKADIKSLALAKRT